MNILKFFLHTPRMTLVWFIHIYQTILSPDHSFWAKKIYPMGYCKFYPTCSEYGKQSIQKRGVIVGSIKAVWRILRCNPWNSGGIDLP